MIRRARSIPIRFNSIRRNKIPMTAGNSFESLSASLTMIKTGATPKA
jgi:hypothetical protein